MERLWNADSHAATHSKLQYYHHRFFRNIFPLVFIYVCAFMAQVMAPVGSSLKRYCSGYLQTVLGLLTGA